MKKITNAPVMYTNNTILIYDIIDQYGVTAEGFESEMESFGSTSDLDVRINSKGGDVYDGMAIYNSIRRHTGKVTTYIDGLAASMLSVIAMAGDNVVMAETAMIMIHNPAAILIGDAKKLRLQADVLDKVKDTAISAYQTKSKLSTEELTALMDDETWFTAEEALFFGFIDEISEPLEMAASLKEYDLSEFKNAPKKQQSKQTVKINVKGKTNLSEEDVVNILQNAINDKPEQLFSTQSTVVETTKEAIMPKKDESTVNVDENKIKADAIQVGIKLEADRCADINLIFSDFSDHKEVLDVCLKDPEITSDIARMKLLDVIGKNSEPLAKDARINVGLNSHEKFREAGAEAMEMRAGTIPTKSNNDLHGRSLIEMARMSCEIDGVNIAGMGKREFIGIAMNSTSDFPFILSNSANKSMQRGYEESLETYMMWTSTGSLSDFKIADRNVLSLFDNLEEVKEGAEYKHGKFTEGKEQIQLLTYGKTFAMTRQMVINDDLRAFTVVPERMGRAARRKVGDIVYAILNANPTMADGFSLFSPQHSNLAGTGGAISTTTLDAARTAMRLQKDTSGNANLNIRPAYLNTPVAVEGVALEVLSSQYHIAGNANDPNRPNSVAGMATVVAESRLDSASSTAWYLSANPNVNETIEVAFLDGVDAPFIDMMNGWTTDGVTAKVRIDAAAKALDHRGLYKNAG